MAAKTNGSQVHDLLPRNLPPYEPGKAYTLKSLEGEILYIPCSNSAMRLLVTGKETEGAFAIVGTGGGQSAPIGFHVSYDLCDPAIVPAEVAALPVYQGLTDPSSTTGRHMIYFSA